MYLRVVFVATLAALASLAAAQAPPAPAGATQKPLIPLAASTLADDADRYYGENVTVTGAVDQTFSKHAFSIDQDRTTSSGTDVLVLARWLSGQVLVNSQVTVIGEVVKFDPDAADALNDFGVNLSSEIASKYRGRPAVLASSVIGLAGIDLARRPPPPMTAEETAYAAVMKEVGAANTTLRKALEATDATLARDNAVVLKQAFTRTAAFWKARGTTDATALADEARKLAEAIEQAAARGRWDEVKTSTGSLGQTCQKCHGAHRERLDDGSYRIKRDAK